MNQKSKNSGSTLVMVVVAIAFIGILGSLVISMTMMNIQMKTMDSQSKENFYSTEAIMRDVKGSIEEIAVDCMEEAYKEVLLNYASYTKDVKNISNMFDDLYLHKLKDALSLTSNPDAYDVDKIKGKIEADSSSCFMNVASDTVHNQISIHYDESYGPKERYVKLCNIEIEYKNPKNQQLTTIKTDLIIYSPSMAFGTSAGYPEYTNYAVIANKQFATEITNSNSKVKGNLYAGDLGVQCLNGTLSILGNQCVTRGNLSVINTATLNVGSSDPLNPIYTDVWAENITTERFTATSTSPANLEINGNCYVSNDLVLNAQYSNVTVNGKYYGYSFNQQNLEKSNALWAESMIKSNYSSAVLINGKKCSLDLGGINTFFLLGHSFVAPETDNDILMGQSLAVKSDQTMYLVPKEFMKNSKNPTMDTVETDPKDNLTALPAYLDSLLKDNKVKKYVYTYFGEQTTYFYWDFLNQTCANEYFDYMYGSADESKKKSFERQLAMYVDATGNGIKLPADMSPDIGGYVYNYDVTTKTTTTGSALIANPDEMTPSIVSNSRSMALRYKSLQLELKSNSAMATADDIRLEDKTSNPLFNNIITHDVSTGACVISTELAGGNKVLEIDLDNNGAKDTKVVITDNKSGSAYSVGSQGELVGKRSGIIIATGDVLINNDFEGMIIAGGSVYITNSAVVSANVSMVQEILQYGMDHFSAGTPDTNFIHYFTVYKDGIGSGSGALGTANVSSSISYSNWKKNED